MINHWKIVWVWHKKICNYAMYCISFSVKHYNIITISSYLTFNFLSIYHTNNLTFLIGRIH